LEKRQEMMGDKIRQSQDTERTTTFGLKEEEDKGYLDTVGTMMKFFE
jgi:hypothetical protein